MRQNPWLLIFFGGVGYTILFNLLLWGTLSNSWPVWILIGGGLALLILFGMIATQMPAEARQTLSTTANSDTYGGLLLGGIILLVSLSALATGEVYARGNPASQWMVYRFHPNAEVITAYPNQALLDTATDPLLDFYVSIDDEGFRKVEPTNLQIEQQVRILCLGDSFTFGYGVNDDETYPHFLERALENRLGNDYDVTVYSAALPWWTIDSQLRIYEYLRDQGQDFDAVILAYFPSNDINDLAFTDNLRETVRSYPIPASLTANSALVRWIQTQRQAVGISDWETAASEGTQGSDLDELYSEYKNLFDQLYSAVIENEQDFYLARIDGYQRAYTEEFIPQGQFIIDLAEDYQIPLILMDYRDEDYLAPLDPHFSPAGNQHFAETIADAIAPKYRPPIVFSQSNITIFALPDGIYHLYRFENGQGVYFGQFTADELNGGEFLSDIEDGWRVEVSEIEGEKFVLSIYDENENLITDAIQYPFSE